MTDKQMEKQAFMSLLTEALPWLSKAAIGVGGARGLYHGAKLYGKNIAQGGRKAWQGTKNVANYATIGALRGFEAIPHAVGWAVVPNAVRLGRWLTKSRFLPQSWKNGIRHTVVQRAHLANKMRARDPYLWDFEPAARRAVANVAGGQVVGPMYDVAELMLKAPFYRRFRDASKAAENVAAKAPQLSLYNSITTPQRLTPSPVFARGIEVPMTPRPVNQYVNNGAVTVPISIRKSPVTA